MSEHEDLGPMPSPTAEEPQLLPGGPDAVGEISTDPVVPDVDPGLNPATGDVPAAAAEGEDTSTAATQGQADAVDPAGESPA